MLKVTLHKSGSSLSINIPKAILDLINAKEGTEFEVQIGEKPIPVIHLKMLDSNGVENQ